MSRIVRSRVVDEDIVKGKSVVVIEDSMEAHRSITACHINDDFTAVAAAVCSYMSISVTGLLFLVW